MTFIFNSGVTLATTLCLLAIFAGPNSATAMDPQFELDPAAIAVSGKPSKPAKKSEKRTNNPSAAEKLNPVAAQRVEEIYTVKSGDSLIKILMRVYRLEFDEASHFVKEISRENKIDNADQIKIGQKIAIPAMLRRADGSKNLTRSKQGVSRGSGAAETPGHSLKLESPIPMLSEQETVDRVRETWDRIVPAKPDLPKLKPLVLQTPTFTLTLDAERYPTFAAMDGGLILLDQGGAIPPLIKSLINEKDPTVRIVSDSQSGTKTFMSSLLKAGGFHSVEENSSMDFGTDPKLSFRSDFRIEKSPESRINKDLVLVNSGLGATPPVLSEFLKKEGFSLYEPFATLKKYAVNNSRTIHQITAKNQADIVDAILKAFSVSPDLDRRLDVYGADNNGISLSVKAERYFERGGQRFVITSFNGDPVNYTLFRILETKGFQVVILEAQDDFRKVSEKILASAKIKGGFAKHDLLLNSAANYSLQMSGFNLDDADLPGGGMFLTNIEMDGLISELLTENGYSIKSR
jgi:hypothetical protein